MVFWSLIWLVDTTAEVQGRAVVGIFGKVMLGPALFLVPPLPSPLRLDPRVRLCEKNISRVQFAHRGFEGRSTLINVANVYSRLHCSFWRWTGTPTRSQRKTVKWKTNRNWILLPEIMQLLITNSPLNGSKWTNSICSNCNMVSIIADRSNRSIVSRMIKYYWVVELW